MKNSCLNCQYLGWAYRDANPETGSGNDEYEICRAQEEMEIPEPVFDCPLWVEEESADDESYQFLSVSELLR